MTARHTAIVTGANHGTGAATAQALARRGCAVLCTFLVSMTRPIPEPLRHTAITAQDAAAAIPASGSNGGSGAWVAPPSTTLSDQRLALRSSASSRTMLPIKAVSARCYRNFNSTGYPLSLLTHLERYHPKSNCESCSGGWTLWRTGAGSGGGWSLGR